MNTPATDLRNAALIVEHGWTQHKLMDAMTGDVCAVGALNLAAGWELNSTKVNPGVRRYSFFAKERDNHARRTDTAIVILSEYLRRRRQSGNVEVWNDNPHRTAAQVASAMRRAADEWQAVHQPAPAQSELELAGGPTE